MSDLHQLEEWMAGLLGQLSPSQRKKLMQQWARNLRKRNQKSIQLQQNPDGAGFEARKPQVRNKAGRVRRKMFTKLRAARYMKAKATASTAEVTFDGGGAQRIARVHHYGLRDRVNKRGLIVKYPERKLLGINDADVAAIGDELITHLAR